MISFNGFLVVFLLIFLLPLQAIIPSKPELSTDHGFGSAMAAASADLQRIRQAIENVTSPFCYGGHSGELAAREGNHHHFCFTQASRYIYIYIHDLI